jgi:hypothetical protein
MVSRMTFINRKICARAGARYRPDDDHLPALIKLAALTTPAPAVDTDIVPALIANLGDQAG